METLQDPVVILLSLLLIMMLIWTIFSSSYKIKLSKYDNEAKFRNILKGSYETPPNNSPGYGVVMTHLCREDPTGKFVIHYEVYAINLTSPFTAAHFHLGAPGVIGPPITKIPLTKTITNGITIYEGRGKWFLNVDAEYAEKLNNMTPQQIYDELAKGNIYFNLHTTKYPNGELRAQITNFSYYNSSFHVLE